jgi:branched-subunit amino acid aminotransferase/4-amino-4-deoxychorismate lyase
MSPHPENIRASSSSAQPAEAAQTAGFEAALGQLAELVSQLESGGLGLSESIDAYERGVALRTVRVTQVPESCWPLAAKVRSRLHYYLADREAAAAEPGARAILAHADGRISETSTANVAVVRAGRIVVPPPADALPGVSLAFARDLAERLAIPWQDQSLHSSDLATADEILLTSTPNCLLPAVRFDGRPVGAAAPGPVFRRLLAAWSDLVGLDIAAQARRERVRP